MRIDLWRAAILLSVCFPLTADAAITLPGGIQASDAWQFSFNNYQVSSGDVDLSGQLHLYVFEASAAPFANKINFLFTNDATLRSNIAEIWFSDGAYLRPPQVITSSAGVSYTTTPENGSDRPPQINDWQTTAYAGARGDLSPERTGQGGVRNGVDKSDEWLSIGFDYAQSPIQKNFSDVIEGLTNPTARNPRFRIALHVQQLTSPSGSDTWVLGDGVDLDPAPTLPNAEPVPEPATLSLWLLGTLCCTIAINRRRQAVTLSQPGC